MEPQSVLLAEDNPDDAELAVCALRKYNLANDIVVVRDGVEALDYLYRRGSCAERSGGNPVLVLLDLGMPRMGGIEVLREIKRTPDLQSVRVVVLTASHESPDLEEASRLGVDAYVVKPVHFDKLVEAVKHIGLSWVLTSSAAPRKAG